MDVCAATIALVTQSTSTILCIFKINIVAIEILKCNIPIILRTANPRASKASENLGRGGRDAYVRMAWCMVSAFATFSQH